MIAFIGLAVVWVIGVIGVMVVGMVIMYMRASDLNNSQIPLRHLLRDSCLDRSEFWQLSDQYKNRQKIEH